MKNNLMFACLLLTFGMFACQTNTSTETEQSQETTEVDLAAEEAAIKAVTQQQSNAFYERNYEEEAAVWAHEPYILRMGGTTGNKTISWDSIGTGYRNFFEQATAVPDDFKKSFSNYHIRVNNSSAWAVYDQQLEWTNGEGVKQNRVSYEVRFLEKVDGQWKIVMMLNGPYPTEEAEG